MIIENNTIIFKSLPEFFHKEKKGLKCNTVRTIKDKYEFMELVNFIAEFNLLPRTQIQIINAVTQESFTRRLTDISAFEGHFIFSWEHDT